MLELAGNKFASALREMIEPLRPALLLCVIVSMLFASSCHPIFAPHSLQQSELGYRLDDPSVAPTGFSDVQWKAMLLAGDNSIGAFRRTFGLRTP